ncbi:hypothetical protein VIN01S_33350 [Vibrio inusitatus NBRC 102082]|uniref:Uncharacterized protein n=1 Tax=Vibrio inusitatus NBRC 102082 TaxID=1219070 RepID=A0A4Y3HZS6_9VIBR|nr:hypothetical protein VIN01S_33350 [Vibrio inusitatus NBRC 102082]
MRGSQLRFLFLKLRDFTTGGWITSGWYFVWDRNMESINKTANESNFSLAVLLLV